MRRFNILFLALTGLAIAEAFAPPSSWQPSRSIQKKTTSLNGMFDFLADAFKNEEYEDRRAQASHILVSSEEEALVVMKDISEGKAFADAAREFSSCPSSQKGGSLGVFEPGTMVQEFDDVCFDASVPVGEVVGPIQTQFGYHLIKVEKRFMNEDKSEGSPAF